MNYKNFCVEPEYSDSNKSYIGEITGETSLGSVKAASLEDFEKLFHQTVEGYLDEKKSRSSRRRTGWIIIALAAIALVVTMVVTCPDESKHKEVLCDRLSVLFDDNSDGDSDGFSLLGAMIGKKIVKAVVDDSLVVDNYVLFNIGRLSLDGEENTVSVGVLGHVFTASRDKIRKVMQEDEEDQDTLRLTCNFPCETIQRFCLV